MSAVAAGAVFAIVGVTAPAASAAENLGKVRGYSFFEQALSDRIAVSVNQQNGNLLVSSPDVRVAAGTGPGIDVARAYNSLDSSAGSVGAKGWRLTVGQDFSCQINATTRDATLRMPGGAEAKFTWTGSAYTTPTGYDAKLTDASSALTLTENQSQTAWKFSYGSGYVGCKLVSQADRNGRAISYGYDASNRLETITDGHGRVTELAYSYGKLSEITDPAGRTGFYVYNAANLLSVYTDPAGESSYFAYTGDGKLSKISTPDGRETNIAYWPAGDARAGRVKSILRVTNTTAQTGYTWGFDYNFGLAVPTGTVTDPNNNATTYAFKPSDGGKVSNVTDALGRPAPTTYTANSNVETSRTPTNTAGSVPSVNNLYDTSGNLTGTETLATGTSKLFTSNAFATASTVKGYQWLPSFAQDAQDKASGSTTRGTTFTYDTNGNLKKATRGAGNGSIELGYGTGADGKPGRLAWSQDGNLNQTSYAYDAKDNLTAVTPPSSALTPGSASAFGATTIDYSGTAGADLALSRPSKITDGRGNQTLFTYDDMDRPIVIVYKNSGGTEEARYNLSYDTDGNLLEREILAGGVSKLYEFSYDQLGRLTDETHPTGQVTDYTHDGPGNLKTIVDDSGTVSYTYDAINRQKTVKSPEATNPISYTYADTIGNALTEMITLPNGVATTNLWDPAGRMTSTESKKGTTVVQKFAYEYLLGANQQSLVSKETDKDGTAISYGYDPGNRLTSATGGATNYSYAYDNAGNITSKVAGSTTTNAKYNQVNELCWRLNGTSGNACGTTPSGGTGYAYDKAGNETNATGTRASAYNARNQLTSLTPNGGSAIAMDYASPGQALRVKQGNTTILNNQLGIGSYTTSGTPTYFTHDEAGKTIAQRLPSGSAANQVTYLLGDQLGSTRTLVDSTGAVVRRLAYEPYGTDKSPAGSWTTTTPFQFAGGEKDQSGLYHYGERYYDPSVGRWTQPDPLNQITDIAQANRYGYAASNPVNVTDLSGLYVGEGLVNRLVSQRRKIVGGVRKYIGWIDRPGQIKQAAECGWGLGKGSVTQCDPVELVLGDDVDPAY